LCTKYTDYLFLQTKLLVIMTKTRLLRALLLCSMFVMLLQQSWAQSKTITGKVTDDKGAAVVGASVLAKGTKTGTSTDADGNFKLTVSSGVNALVISYVGFAPQEVSVAASSVVSVSLVPQNQTLSDVVVVGYGTSRKKDLTGAVANVTAKDFNQGIVTNPIQQIQGKVSGLVITVPGGDPNQAPLIRLRGQTSLTGGQNPLIVLDGIPLDDANQLNNIPANDIASYDVLKDASAAAVYGSRGANGVIIVNTKKGQSGQAKVEYTGYVGLDKQAKKYDILSASEWRAATGANGAAIDKGANTDWQDAIARTAYAHNHTIAVSGGSKGFSYRGSVNYLDQQGIILKSGKNGYGLRFNAQQKALDDKLEIQLGIVSTTLNKDLTNYANISKVFNTPPVYPIYNADGSYYTFTDFEQYNTVEHINQEYNKGYEYLSLLSGRVDYELMKGLKVGVLGSISHFNNQTHFFQPTFPGEGNYNNANDVNSNLDSKKGDFHINYIHEFGKHNIAFTGVYEYNDFTYNSLGASGSNFLVPESQDNNFSSAIDPTKVSASSYKNEYNLISFLGRVAYNYNSKYYVTATIRRDGSSKFGVNNRWGNFPSFDFAWRLSQENFLKGVSWLNELKLRVGYGVTGNSDAIDPYATLTLYNPIGRYYNAALGIYPQAYSITQNANPDLKWEERHGRNIGLDFSILNNRISGDINYFNDKTQNLLYYYSVPTPPFFVNTILANVGDLSNKGFELALTAQIVKKRDFTWTANGQITFIQTRVESLSGTYRGYKLQTDQIPGATAVGRGLSSYPITYLKPGYTPYEFYLPHYLGTDKSGNQLLDSNGKAVLASSANVSKYYIDPSPDFTYGLTNSFTYKNWNFSFFLRGVHGQKIFNNTRLNFDNINRLPGNNVTKEALTNGIKDAATVSDLWLQKASYLRLDNAKIGYTFNHIKGIQNLGVYFAANNLFVITPYKGLDPEIQTSNTGPNQAYLDVTYYGAAFYPRTRSFSLGVNVSFQ
jgi:TonB-linked SusC/RagA family outer membrane protein